MEWNPKPPLTWRLELGYITHGDIDTEEAKHITDLSHLKMWQARILYAVKALKVPTDVFSGDNEATAERGSFIFFLALCNPFIAGGLYGNRWHAQQLQASAQAEADSLTPRITRYIQTHGGDAKAILAAEKAERLKTGNILIPDVTIDTYSSALPTSVIQGRANDVKRKLEPIRSEVAQDYAYWCQLNQWFTDYQLPPKYRNGKDFYNSIAFNPHGINPQQGLPASSTTPR